MRGKRSVHRHRLAVFALVVPIAAVGTAHLASNVIPISYAGTTTVPVAASVTGLSAARSLSVPGPPAVLSPSPVPSLPPTPDPIAKSSAAAATTLLAAIHATIDVATEDGTEYYEFRHVAATLTSGGVPVAGETVTLTTGGVVICSAQTQQNGAASCDAGGAGTLVAEAEFRGGKPTSFTATFAGHDDLAGSTSVGALRAIADGPNAPDPSRSPEGRSERPA